MIDMARIDMDCPVIDVVGPDREKARCPRACRPALFAHAEMSADSRRRVPPANPGRLYNPVRLAQRVQ